MIKNSLDGLNSDRDSCIVVWPVSPYAVRSASKNFKDSIIKFWLSGLIFIFKAKETPLNRLAPWSEQPFES
jgi:hypothetical protein